MKRAFTIVEIAIVLVVLGIIIAASVSAIGIVEASNWRRDIAKITSIRTSIYINIIDSANAFLKASNKNTVIDINKLISENIIDASDVNLKIFRNYVDGKNSTPLKLIWCQDNNTGTGIRFKPKSIIATNIGSSDLCLSIGDIKLVNKIASQIITPKKACYLELFLDNLDLDTGKGRLWAGIKLENKDINFNSCPSQSTAEYSLGNNIDNAAGAWGFLIYP